MLTLFTVAKPFRGEFAVIQRNAIRSWARLRPACEILLIGNEEGLQDIAKETGAVHLSEVARNEFGTPLVSSVFSEAEKHAHYSHLCYLNADIILLSDFLPAVRRVLDWDPCSLIVGRRWDLDLGAPIDWMAGDGEQSVRAQLRVRATLHSHMGIDYFVFQSGLWDFIPPLAIGRGLWDGWLISRARALAKSVVDATACLTAVHQNHSYSHHPKGEAGVWYGAEMKRNLSLGGGLRSACTVRDATHTLTPRRIIPRLVPYDLHRCLVVPLVTQRWARPLIQLKKVLVPGSRSTFTEERP
jgi:hypothetical protein